jgi:sugar O-acyltransferase (sialic acid O-acetyltransferase NeuD family)
VSFGEPANGSDPRRAPDRELFVVGAGWFASEVASWVSDAGWAVRGLVEMLNPARVGSRHDGYAVVAAESLPAGTPVVVAGGREDMRREGWALVERQGCVPATVVHPSAHVGAGVTLAPGALVAPAAVIGAGTHVGEHAFVARGALVGHHARVGPFVRLMPGSNIAGHVVCGANATVGMSAAVIDHVTVGEGAVVAAGAVVVRDVPAQMRVQGVPARAFG